MYISAFPKNQESTLYAVLMPTEISLMLIRILNPQPLRYCGNVKFIVGGNNRNGRSGVAIPAVKQYRRSQLYGIVSPWLVTSCKFDCGVHQMFVNRDVSISMLPIIEEFSDSCISGRKFEVSHTASTDNS